MDMAIISIQNKIGHHSQQLHGFLYFFFGDAFLTLEASCFLLGVIFFGTWISNGSGVSTSKGFGTSIFTIWR